MDRKKELTIQRAQIHEVLKHKIEKKNALDLEILELKYDYARVDRELAEMDIKVIKPGASGKGKPRQVTLSMDQVRDIAKRLGVKLDEKDD